MKKRLSLNKEKITELSKEQSTSVVGGGTNNSTEANFTCCWCTSSGGEETAYTNCCQSTPEQGTLCPPDKVQIS